MGKALLQLGIEYNFIKERRSSTERGVVQSGRDVVSSGRGVIQCMKDVFQSRILGKGES